MGIVEFFTSADVSLSNKLLEIVYFLMGIITFYVAAKTVTEKDHPSRYPTALFWGILGVLLAFGRFIPNYINGILIIIMSLPSIFNLVKRGNPQKMDENFAVKMADKLGGKLFVPTLLMAVFSIIFAVFTKISPQVGIGIGVIVAIVIVMLFSKQNTVKVFFDDSRRLLDSVGALSLLPLLLAALGTIFTKSGVGEVVAGLVGTIIPEGNVTVGVIVFCIGMPLFTMVMGNAFAAITVMTVGIGAPFVLAYGLDPNVVGIVALTCGYCGTLVTPMAANFNIVPVAVLDMKDKYGVIKKQLLLAGILLVAQIAYMLILA